MKIAKTIMIVAAPLVIAACGSNFEWFPPVSDTTPPVVKATIGTNSAIFSNGTTHFSIPATVILSANEPATIYYTTSTTTEPTTPYTAPFNLDATNTILKFFGIDNAKNQSSTVIRILKTP